MLLSEEYFEKYRELDPYLIYVNEPYPKTNFYGRLKEDAPANIKALFKKFIEDEIRMKPLYDEC
jgi:hypothetical protein